MYVYLEKKNVKLVFSTVLLIYFLVFTFCTFLRQLLLLHYTLMISSQTDQCYFYKKHISFTNGIFDMQTSLTILFTILKTKNHAYLIFNFAMTWLLNIHVASVLNILQNNHNAICCDICNLRVHIKCSNVTKFCYRKLQNSQDPYYCKKCIKQILPFPELTESQLNRVTKRSLISSPKKII